MNPSVRKKSRHRTAPVTRMSVGGKTLCEGEQCIGGAPAGGQVDPSAGPPPSPPAEGEAPGSSMGLGDGENCHRDGCIGLE